MWNSSRVVIGTCFQDGWCTAYVRLDVALPPGEYTLGAQIWNPNSQQFAGNTIVLRNGLTELSSSGELACGEQSLVTGKVVLEEEGSVVPVSLRSSVEWSPSQPDERSLGFVLISWFCERSPA